MDEKIERKLSRVRERREFIKQAGKRATKTAVVIPAVALLMSASSKPAHARASRVTYPPWGP